MSELNIVELAHRKEKFMLFLAECGGKHIECCNSWVPAHKIVRYEMSSMFGCILDCNHCEYSYNYNGDLSLDQLKEQFMLLKHTSIHYWDEAKKIVISFCRMGEPTMSDHVMPFIRWVWAQNRHKREKLVFEIPTVAPQLGANMLLEAKKFAAIEAARIRPVVTLNAVTENFRRGVTGLEMIEPVKLTFLLRGWKARPIVFLQPIETGVLVSWDLKEMFEGLNVQLCWNHIYNSIPTTLRGFKLVSYRSHYGSHVKFVARGLKEKADIEVALYDKPYHGINYPEEFNPGQYFSLLMKENLVRKVAEYKAVS